MTRNLTTVSPEDLRYGMKIVQNNGEEITVTGEVEVIGDMVEVPIKIGTLRIPNEKVQIVDDFAERKRLIYMMGSLCEDPYGAPTNAFDEYVPGVAECILHQTPVVGEDHGGVAKELIMKALVDPSYTFPDTRI